MSAFTPIPPRSATEMFELEQAEGLKIISDLAEAGLVKAYARLIERVQPCGSRESVRDKRIAPAMWRRIISEGKVSEVLSGTVRLEGSSDFGGGPQVSLIGIRFDPASVRTAALEHGSASAQALQPSSPARTARQLVTEPVDLPVLAPDHTAQSKPPREEPRSISSNAAQLKVEEAMAMLNIGRTKLYDLIAKEELELVKVGAGSRITRRSIDAFMVKGGA